MESLGTVWWVEHYGHEVIEVLRDVKRPAGVVQKVAGPNCARVQWAALLG
jgi:hypothetical protein